ncbi:Peptidase S1 [Modestobacter italicus]|uniref:Peptidase S1 n=1 Tax=Modestobacter italicus (strain DSM 44449 / CECT 9708 / BC 501) TaxID=2732864 RepID=I4EU92_MODI5|nr:Peptidase S1 [Modestobacter marinus]
MAISTLGALGIAAGGFYGVHAASGGTTTAVRSLAAPATDPTVVLGGRGGYGWDPRTLGGGTSTPGTTGSAADSVAAAGQATAAQLVGVVDITTVLGYEGGEAAGTGMVLTADGEVLTNNHVVEGATSITVTVLSTGQSYPATVVGTDPTDDVAVLQLAGASGLDAVAVDDDGVAVGDAVTAVGNAGDEAGTAAAAGTVTALDQSITATDESGQDAEQLTGLIGIAADVEAGDSGGPLYDAEGEVAGMDTAASSTGGQAYAIPIATALSIADQITSGVDDATVHQGYPAFLGISVQATGAGGATVAGVVDGGPADQAGLAAGSVVTAIDGVPITSADDVSSVLAGHAPGDPVSVTWTDGSGQPRTATVTLATGPAD